MADQRTPEPYRVFFPLGLFVAILAVVPWLLFYFGITASYPLVVHARLMLMGFLGSFISGFFMTAIPKMTGTFPATKLEIQIVFAMVVAQVFLSLLGVGTFANILSVFQIGALAFFALRRFRKRKQIGPAHLNYVVASLVSGVLGTAIFAINDLAGSAVGAWGAKLYFQAFVLNLILGIGSKLIPALSRKNDNFNPAMATLEKKWVVWCEVLFFNSSFLLEAFVDSRVGILVRILFIGYFLVRRFKLFKPTLDQTYLGFGLSLSTLFLILPYVAILIWPQYELALLHLLFIGGFALTTLLISVRVTLAHGGFGLSLEKTSQHLLVTSFAMIALALFRALAPIVNSQNTAFFIEVSALAWILVIAVWISKYLRKYFTVQASQC